MYRIAAHTLIVLLAILVSIPLVAQEKKKKKRRGQQPQQVRAVLKKLEQVDLTGEQAAKVEELTKEYTAKIKAAQDKLGDGLRTVTEARKKANADGKKGRQVQAAINAELSEEQQAAWKELQGANQQYRAAVAKLLTAEQREKSGLQAGNAGKKKGKRKKDKDGQAAG